MNTPADAINWGSGPTPPAAAPLLAEPVAALFARLENAPPVPMLIEHFLPGVGITLLHGQPRTMKSLIGEAVAIAVTTGTPLFNSTAHAVPSAGPVWLVTDEDPELEVRDRLMALMVGGAVETPPPVLHVSIGRGLDFDDEETQLRILGYVRDHRIGLLIVDPVRSATACADQGPKELRPFAQFLRYLMRETGSAILLVHHDVKPPVAGRDDRARPLRASGGGLFSIADSPIHVERVEEGLSLVVPTSWKFGTAPASLQVRLEADAPRHAHLMRLTAETTTATDAEGLALRTRILDHLTTHGRDCSSHLAQALRARKENVVAMLETLYADGTLDCARVGRRRDYFLRTSEREQ